LLNKYYAENFKESFDNSLSDEVVYIGQNRIRDCKDILSPTRTYAPLVKTLLENHFDKIHGLIHCSGGGQTKCLKYLPSNVKEVKDNLFETPKIFKQIQAAAEADNREMYQVFNMGCRMEIYTDENFASTIIKESAHFNIDAQIIGRVEPNNRKVLIIKTAKGDLVF
jgi:phosphoribosylformylglycinamidine cyclo-ligase